MARARVLACLTVAVATLSLMPACGSNDSSPRARKPILPLVVSPHVPATYVVEDPECQNATAEVPLTKTEIRSWDGDQVVTREVQFHDVKTTDSLVSRSINISTFRDVFE